MLLFLVASVVAFVAGGLAMLVTVRCAAAREPVRPSRPCNAVGRDGFVLCTLAHGHGGPHCDEDYDCKWSDRDPSDW